MLPPLGLLLCAREPAPQPQPLLLVLRLCSVSGRYSNLAISLGIAVPSGIGVALSVLGNNTGSLIGVAISASLLPPAVNWGLMWGYAIVAAAQDQSIRSGTDDAGANVYDGTRNFPPRLGCLCRRTVRCLFPSLAL